MNFRNEKKFLKSSKMSNQIPEEKVIECYDKSTDEPIFTVEISDRFLTDDDQRRSNGEALRQRLSSVGM